MIRLNMRKYIMKTLLLFFAVLSVLVLSGCNDYVKQDERKLIFDNLQTLQFELKKDGIVDFDQDIQRLILGVSNEKIKRTQLRYSYNEYKKIYNKIISSNYHDTHKMRAALLRFHYAIYLGEIDKTEIKESIAEIKKTMENIEKLFKAEAEK